ncbi:MAG: DUF255 domain-containing protein [Bacteroidia bacterium]|nr:DUF255 domain-containing protein [Bacteroidia bacterium]MCF8428174.1 DUF255 domain-containing protein [Bacteroidia bacterium]MCF8445438.1 DUF255 domain-containing protein [Bacteroidia bacterium]
MKKIISLAFGLILLSSFIKPKEEELKWYQWNEGYPIAKKEKKLILVDAYTDWCGWCKKMDRDTYSHPEVIKKLNKHFIVIKFNPEQRDKTYDIDGQTFSARDFFAQLGRGENTGFPTTYFIDPQKQSLFIDPGYHDATAFLGILDHVIEDAKKK